MQEKNLPTPVTPDKPTAQSPEVDASTTGEIVSIPTPMTPETKTSTDDQVNQSGPVQQVALPTDLPQPMSTTIIPATDNTTVSASSDPIVADDVDVIEKAWVQKAKSIVNQTKTDPYQQEEEVSKLQIDYQLKRFGDSAPDK